MRPQTAACLAGLCILGLSFSGFAEVRQTGRDWQIENAALTLSIDSENGRLRVLHKESGTLWQQESLAEADKQSETVQVRKSPGPVTIDGSDQEWNKDHYVWLPWTGKDGERNLSGSVRLMWDAAHLYLYVRVRDDNVAFGGESAAQWWEADSVEFWIDSVQVGLHLNPDNTIAANSRGEPYPDTEVAVRLIQEDKLPGYAVEVSMPLSVFPVMKDLQPGVRFSFALGLNDADPQPGEPVKRVAQGYYPKTWVHSVPETFTTAVVTDEAWNAPDRNDENDRTAGFTRGAAIQNPGPGKEPDSLGFDLLLVRGQAQAVPVHATLSLVADPAAVDIRLECSGGAETPLRGFAYPSALYPADPASYFMGVADYSDGHYVPVNDRLYRNRRLADFGGDMPWVLVTDGRQGLLAVTLTPFDAAIQMQSRVNDPERCGFPGFFWHPSKGTFGAPRGARWVFFATGGYVQACKIYRQMAREQGYFRTLREKAEANPDVNRLLGAVNWWGGHGLKFVREAVAAGMTHGLINGRWNPDDMEEMKRLGWLVGEYDNYEDIDDSPTIARAKAPVAEHAVVKEDGEFMTAWISRDKDMNPTHTYMKQCTAMMLKSARIVIPEVLETYPYNARFLDVTTATSVKECYSPVHPVNRVQDLLNRQALCRYVSEELGLVTGGEHGRFWDTPYLHYHEGMMGGGMYSWPAGYLRDVASRDELNERYLTYGINPANRAPLFELVYHDCVVDYWYWGACSEYLHQVAPEITDRKTAMNILYGTPPMMWVNNHGLRWGQDAERRKMVEIYRNVCKLHEVIGFQEMQSHAFLNEDRMVQQTVFADGTTCTVNFGKTVFDVPRGNAEKSVLHLGENDFYVKGPAIEQWRCGSGADTLDGTRQETYIRTENFTFIAPAPEAVFSADGFQCSGQIAVRDEAPGRTVIDLDPGASCRVTLDTWRPEWQGKARMIVRLNDAGQPLEHIGQPDNRVLDLAASGTEPLRVLIRSGQEALVPDLTLAPTALRCNGGSVDSATVLRGNDTLGVSQTVTNLGLAPARNVRVNISLDGPGGKSLTEQVIPLIAAGETRTVEANLPVRQADGQRRIYAQLADSETLCLTGRSFSSAAFTGPVDIDAFDWRCSFPIQVPEGACGGLPMEWEGPDLAARGQTDPANLRVLFPDGRAVPAQLDVFPENGGKPVLVFCLPDGLAVGTELKLTVLGMNKGNDRVAPHASRFEVLEDGSLIRMDTYSARITNGTLSQVAVRNPDGTELPVLEQLIVSSKETGWGSEKGTVEQLACIATGPVRAVFSCTKIVSDKFRLQRTWLFYGDRFEVHSQCTPPIASLNRAFYTVSARAFNATGLEADMDGSGNAEDFGFKGVPDWYAVSQPRYSNVCIALTQPRGFTYWDGGRMGQIALDNPGQGLEKRVYIWRPAAVSAAEADAWLQAYRTAPTSGE